MRIAPCCVSVPFKPRVEPKEITISDRVSLAVIREFGVTPCELVTLSRWAHAAKARGRTVADLVADA